jgi:hypothetical protein
MKVRDVVVWQKGGAEYRGRVEKVMEAPERALVQVLSSDSGDSTLVKAIISGEDLEVVKETREDRADRILRNGGVLYQEGKKFEVRSESRDMVYPVDLEIPGCQCQDWSRGHFCKHLRAAAKWLGRADLYSRARAVVENNSQWYHGQSRVIWEGNGEKAEVYESQQMLYLSMDGVRVKCGQLNPTSGWFWQLEVEDYREWVRALNGKSERAHRSGHEPEKVEVR